MSVQVLSIIAGIILVICVYLKTGLEHDVENEVARANENVPKNNSSKSINKPKVKTAAEREERLLVKKFLIAIFGIMIELTLVFLGITGALEFDNYQERKDVLRNVQYTKEYVEATEKTFSELLGMYCSGKCDAEDIKFNLTINEAMLDVITETESARRQIKPLAISFVFSIREHIESIISLMHEETFDDNRIEACTEEILYLLDMLNEVLSSIETHLSTGNEKQLKETIESLYDSLRNHQADMYLTNWTFN